MKIQLTCSKCGTDDYIKTITVYGITIECKRCHNKIHKRYLLPLISTAEEDIECMFEFENGRTMTKEESTEIFGGRY